MKDKITVTVTLNGAERTVEVPIPDVLRHSTGKMAIGAALGPAILKTAILPLAESISKSQGEPVRWSSQEIERREA